MTDRREIAAAASAPGSPEPRPPISDYLRALLPRIFARSENFVAGRYWALEALFLAVLVSAFFSGGIDDRLWRVTNNNWFHSYYQKIEHPLLNLPELYAPHTHDAKLNFRLTVPVVLYTLGVSPDQRWVLPALTACATCGIIFLSCVFAFRVTGDRVCGVYTALAVSATYIGSFGFMIYYDAIAICQLVLAMLPGMPWALRGLLVFTAAFTDERAFLVAPFLLVQSICSPGATGGIWRRLVGAESLAVAGGMAAYVFVRFALARFAGLDTATGGLGIADLLGNVDFWHAGIWLALKGGWLLVGLAALALWRAGHRLPAAVYGGMILVTLGGAFLVEDVVRSAAYVFPAFLIALAVLGAHEKIRWMRFYCLAAFAISIAAGNYNVWRSQITWFKPLAAEALYSLLHAVLKTN